jgi:hypothetical protein
MNWGKEDHQENPRMHRMYDLYYVYLKKNMKIQYDAEYHETSFILIEKGWKL